MVYFLKKASHIPEIKANKIITQDNFEIGSMNTLWK